MTSNDEARNAFLTFSFPLKNHLGKDVFVRKFSPEGTGADHILQPRHNLTASDIQLIPQVLANPFHYCVDPNNPHYRNYYGLRPSFGTGELLKIVTKANLNGTETIITVYLARKIKKTLSEIKFVG